MRRIFWRLYAAARHFATDDGLMVAAGTAYYVALSFFPLLLVLVAGLGLVLEWTQLGQDARMQLLTAIEQQVSPELAAEVKRALMSVSEQAPTGGPIGFIALIISAIAIFTQLDAGFDRIWGLPHDRILGWWEWLGQRVLVRLKALLMLAATGGFVIAVMVTSMVLAGVRAALEPAQKLGPWMYAMSSVGLNLALNFIAFTAMYLIIPKARIRLPDAIRGGVLAALLWEIGRQALAAYLLRLNYPSAYGIIGSFMAIMLWAYYAMLVVFYGAEYVRVLWDERRAAAPPRSPAK